MSDILTWIGVFQAEIYGVIADRIDAVSASGDWLAFSAIMPLGVLFGAAHGLTPGHNKMVLASYVMGDRVPVIRASWMALVLTAVHVGSAVVIALGAGFLVSRTMTSAGEAPLLETVSRVLLLGVGLWLILRALRGRQHVHGEGLGVAVIAGLVPCPLTLFVMVFAVSQGVPAAGLMFAAAMLAGVGIVLVLVALAASFGAQAMARSLVLHGATAKIAARSLELVAGLVLTVIVLGQLLD